MAAGLMRASAVMASGTMLSRVLGLLKAMLLVYAIGSVESRGADAFAVGNQLPNMLYALLLGGMLNAVLVPQIVKAAKNADGGSGYINKLLTLISSALFAVTLIAMAAAPFIVWVSALSWEPEQRALATAFAYWCLPQIAFYGLYTVLGEVLNAKSVFGPYTWAPVLNNVIAIAGLVAFVALFGADSKGLRPESDWTWLSIAVLAGSATLGVVGQALILFVSWRRAGIRYRPDFAWRGMGLGATARIAAWSLATIVAMQLAGLVTLNVVNTGSGDGPSTSAMQNVYLIFAMPHSVIAVSLATAYFTRLAEAGQSGDMVAFKADFSASVRRIATVMMLAAAAMFAAAPFLSRIINLGSSELQVDQFWPPLQAYTAALVAFSVMFIVQRAFYALSDTRTPFWFTIVHLVVLIGLSLSLLGLPKQYIGLGFAVVWSISEIFKVLLASFMLRRKIGAIDGRRILVTIVKTVAAAIPAAAAGLAVTVLARTTVPEIGVGLAILLTVAVGAIVSLVYVVALWLLGSAELREIAAWVKGLIRR